MKGKDSLHWMTEIYVTKANLNCQKYIDFLFTAGRPDCNLNVYIGLI